MDFNTGSVGSEKDWLEPCIKLAQGRTDLGLMMVSEWYMNWTLVYSWLGKGLNMA